MSKSNNVFDYLPNKSIELKTIANSLNSLVIGNASIEVSCVAPFDEPRDECITFTDKLNENFFRMFTTEEYHKRERENSDEKLIKALIVNEKAILPSEPLTIPIIKVTNPLKAAIKCVELIHSNNEHAKMPDTANQSSIISKSAKIGKDTQILSFTTIGNNSIIGENVLIESNVTIGDFVNIGDNSVIRSGTRVLKGVQIGRNSVIQSNCVIGSDGFGYIPDPELGLLSVPQIGTVIIEDNVHIGANTCIDRATLGTTKIGQGTKIDNLVQIGHNNKIGKYCIICGKVGISGSCKIGDQVVLGGSVRVADHIKICSGARIGGGAKVIQHINEPGEYAGFPPVKAAEFRRRMLAITKLPEMMKKLKRL